MMRIDEAFGRCREITAREAKNFAYGIRLLPGPKRDAMSALYAYSRRIDDIADGHQSVDDKLRALADVDRQIESLAAGELPDGDDPVLVGVHQAAARFEVPVAAFGEIVQGCRQDATETIYRTADDTESYCRLVAGSVGRLSLGVFGSSDPDLAPGWPTISGSRSSSPTSCATSSRTGPWVGSTCRPRTSTGSPASRI